MTRPDLEKLLGGYAAGTLTPEERRALFDAALADQTLFDAIADEEALREVLADPACRERVQAALAERPRAGFWLRRPAVWTLAAVTAAAAVVLTVTVLRPKPTPAPRQIAMVNNPVRPDVAPSTPAPGAVARVAPRAPAAAGKSDQRVTRSLPPPALVAPRNETAASAPRFAAEPSSQPQGTGAVGGRIDSPAPVAADGVAPPPPVPQAKPMAPPPPPRAVTQSVTVEAASSQIVPSESDAKNQPIESKEMSELSTNGRNPAELMKLTPGVAGGAKQGPLGLRYTVLRRSEGDKDVEVPPGARFGRHESARLRIEPGQDGYLYVLAGKRALFAGPVVANQPVLIVTRPGVLQAVLLPQPDSGPLSTLISRARQQQMDAVGPQRSDGTHLGSGSSGQAAPVLAEISIQSR